MSKSHITPEEMITLVYGEADERTCQRMETHLESCPKCRKIRDELLETMAFFDESDSDSMFGMPPMGIEKRIISGIETYEGGIETIGSNASEQKNREIVRESAIEASAAVSAVNEIMTPCDLARYLRVSENTVYDLLSELPHFNLAGSIRFRRSSIDRWLEISEVNSCSSKMKTDIEEFTPQLWKNLN